MIPPRPATGLPVEPEAPPAGTRREPGFARQTPLQRRPPVCVVGAGNWLLSCDRLGPRVLERIAGRYGEEVELRCTGTAALALLDALDGQDLLLVIDASAEGSGPPGEVRLWVPDLELPPSTGTSVHGLGPVEALVVARTLYPERLPRRLCFVLIDTDHATDSAAEELALEAAVAAVDREIDAWRSSRGAPQPG